MLMLIKQFRFIICTIVVASLGSPLCSTLGCENRSARPDDHLSLEGVKKSQTAVIEENKYYPLTESILNEIRNGNQNHSLFNLEYETSTNEMDRLSFGFGYGNLRGDYSFPSTSEFEGGLYRLIDVEGSLSEKTDKKSFTFKEVSNLLDYISSNENKSYFFSGEEYDGKDIPYQSALSYPDVKKYNLSIMFYKPKTDQNNECWAIFKCVDEYPAQGTPLYGLFQMLENDFITQFEE
jgi:hypothetical protein